MKTLIPFFLLIQVFVPGAPSVGDTSPMENPYARLVAAFRTARCTAVKTVPLKLVNDTLIIDAFRPHYASEFQYPYTLLHAALNSRQSPAKAANYLKVEDRGFTDARELRIPVSKAGHYYLLINDVNRSMLSFCLDRGLRAAPAGLLPGELRVGCVVYE